MSLFICVFVCCVLFTTAFVGRFGRKKRLQRKLRNHFDFYVIGKIIIMRTNALVARSNQEYISIYIFLCSIEVFYI